jgi:hypothetical protein
VLVLSIDPDDPVLTTAESELARARYEANLWRPCRICGARPLPPEIGRVGELEAFAVEHEEDCPVADGAFEAVAVDPVWRRSGRPPRFVAIAAVVTESFELEPIDRGPVFDPRDLNLCPRSLRDAT